MTKQKRGIGELLPCIANTFEEATDVNRQQADIFEDLEGLDWPRKLLEQKQTQEQLYGQLNEIREQAEGERESFAKALREIKTATQQVQRHKYKISSLHKADKSCYKQQIREYERRHEVSARACLNWNKKREFSRGSRFSTERSVRASS